MKAEPPSLSHPKYRPDIDGLRAIAVLSVVAFHAFPKWMPGGFVGVDVFFVISGYLISTIVLENLDKNTFSFAEFYSRRIRRIFPALLLVLFTTLALGWSTLPPDDYGQLGKHVAAGAGFVSNLLLWNESGYFDSAADTKPLLHLWSLGIEEQFYIVWPLLLWVLWRWRSNAFLVIGVIAAASFFLNLKGVEQDATATFYSPQTRFWELLCGCLLAWQVIYRKRASDAGQDKIVGLQLLGTTIGSLLAVLGMLLLCLSFWLINRDSLFPGLWAVVPVLGTVLVLFAGPGAWVNRFILSHRLVVWFGLISFPLYLWHWPLLGFLHIVDEDNPGFLNPAVAVLLSIGLAWITYAFLEKPIRSRTGSSREAVVLLVAMATVGTVGYFATSLRLAVAELDPATEQYRQLGWQIPVGTDKQRALCVQRFPERSTMTQQRRNDNFCLLQKDGPANVLLVGDSLNLSLFPGLSQYDDYNLLMLSASSAAPFYNVRTTETRDNIRELNYKLTNHALDYALSEPAIKVVVMSFAGGPLLTLPRSDFKIVDVSNPARIDAHGIFKEAFELTLRRLLAAKKKVIYVLPNPTLIYEIRNCLSPNDPYGSGDPGKPCAQAYDAHLKRGSREYREWVQSIVKNAPAVTVFDAAQAFCDEVYCWGRKDGPLMYRDSMHLSDFGSRIAAPSLHEAIQQSLR